MAVYQCPGCDYRIDTTVGDSSEGFAPGFDWDAEVPEDWFCPDCGVRDKVDFEKIS
ncbi:rubredoxin [Corynebacterium nuruki]|jgi:rubredoxin|uniref:Rubredoxin n=1 Tax=Corynebacterium nuruki TaxID=1032851 RepID=A0A3D4SW80_9CORY|nr:rubredoxin [Corynebacterium nuruki]HCT13544.1 rubredoxin [Corynebacterium nuruki]